MFIFEDLVILLAVLLDYSIIKTSGASLWLITYGECFAESSPETQIGSRNHLAHRSQPLSGVQLKCLSI